MRQPAKMVHIEAIAEAAELTSAPVRTFLAYRCERGRDKFYHSCLTCGARLSYDYTIIIH